MAPAGSVNSRSGSVWANMTVPALAGEPVRASTSSGNATPEARDPWGRGGGSFEDQRADRHGGFQELRVACRRDAAGYGAPPRPLAAVACLCLLDESVLREVPEVERAVGAALAGELARSRCGQ